MTLISYSTFPQVMGAFLYGKTMRIDAVRVHAESDSVMDKNALSMYYLVRGIRLNMDKS